MRAKHLMWTAIIVGIFSIGCVGGTFYLEPIKQERRAPNQPPANPAGEVVFKSIDVTSFSEELIRKDESIARFAEALEIIFWSRGYVMAEQPRDSSFLLNAKLTSVRSSTGCTGARNYAELGIIIMKDEEVVLQETYKSHRRRGKSASSAFTNAAQECLADFKTDLGIILMKKKYNIMQDS